MKRLLILSLSVFVFSIAGITQSTNPPAPEKKMPAFGINFSGFVKTDIFFDSRQTVAAREGHFLLYPENKKLDADGNDINARWNYNILSIQTRLAGSIWGPDALGAKTSAYLEAEFFGNINPAINTFRLRHAWIKLNWRYTELLVGQTWHPMFVPECSPATVSFNTGAPFVVFSRNPQIRITQSIGNFSIGLTALSQVDFVSDGPDGPNPKYLRNSAIPEMNLQFHFKRSNPDKGRECMFGAGINFQMLTPRLSTTVTLTPAYDTVINGIVEHHDATTATYKTSVHIPAFAANVFAKVKLKPLTIKLGGEYGGDNNAYTMLGGYAVKSVTDALKGFVDYANIRTVAVWAEIHTNGLNWRPGLFGAFSKNLGAADIVTGPYYTRGVNIDYLWRVSPRIEYNIQRLRFAGEIEYTVAGYGKTTEKAAVSDPEAVGNIRFLIGVYYFF
jgi:hypothetical protein